MGIGDYWSTEGIRLILELSSPTSCLIPPALTLASFPRYKHKHKDLSQNQEELTGGVPGPTEA